MDSQTNSRGKPVPVGMWQQRKCCSPGGWERKAVWQHGFHEAWSHLSEATPRMSKLLIDSVCALPPLSTSCCQQACMGCFLWPARFYKGFCLNCLSTNLNFTLSWEEFIHLQGSLESCLLFQPAHWEGVCTPRMHLLWLFSLWGKGGETVCLVYTIHFPCANGRTPFSCCWLFLMEPAMLHSFPMCLPSL